MGAFALKNNALVPPELSAACARPRTLSRPGTSLIQAGGRGGLRSRPHSRLTLIGRASALGFQQACLTDGRPASTRAFGVGRATTPRPPWLLTSLRAGCSVGFRQLGGNVFAERRRRLARPSRGGGVLRTLGFRRRRKASCPMFIGKAARGNSRGGALPHAPKQLANARFFKVVWLYAIGERGDAHPGV